METATQRTSSSKKRPRPPRPPKGARFTADNVVKVLQHVTGWEKWGWDTQWEYVGQKILKISEGQLEELTINSTTDEECLQLVVAFWLLKCSYASWRYLILRLEEWDQDDVANRIHGFAEPLTDPNLNVETLMLLLSSLRVGRLEDCLRVPPSKREEIEQQSKTEGERRRGLIQWYLKYSPFADLADLAGELYRFEETSACQKVKEHIQRVPESTLSLSNVTEVFCQVNNPYQWGGVLGLPMWLNIPLSKTKEMERRYPDIAGRREALLKHYLESVPFPSWKRVAYAAYEENEYGALETILQHYLKGSSESRRHFKVAMKGGFIKSHITKLLLFGPPGVGKTCTKAILLNQPLPSTRVSTPLAERTIHVYRAKVTVSCWELLSREDRNKVIAQAAYCCELANLSDYLQLEASQHVEMTKATSRVSPPIEQGLPSPQRDSSQPPSPTGSQVKQEAATNSPSASPKLAMVTTDDKLILLMDDCSLDEPLDDLHRIQLTDSGGQPQFHEVLPIFLRGSSVYLFFQKLSEMLDEYPNVQYFNEKGEQVCEPYPALHTNVQTFQHCLRVMRSQRSKDRKDKPSRIIVVGTFEDQAHKCKKESIDMKNERLLELLFPEFEKEVVYSSLHPKKKVFFTLDASNPGVAGLKVIDQIRGLISTECTADPVDVPLQWHALEPMLEELAQNEKRDVLRKEECLSVAKQKLHFEEDSFDAALEYLDQLNVIFYYQEILPGVVFASTQVLLDKVTELVLATHKLRQGLLDITFDQSWQRFYDYALVSVEFLSQECFSKHYLPGEFTAKELVVLFNKLFVFAKFNDTEYFMPALLRMLKKEEVDKHRVNKESAASPVALQFPDHGGPRLGVFCATIVSLLSPKNHHPCPWELKLTDSSTPSCLYRNCVEFEIPDYPGTVILIDSFKHFEIHLRLPDCANDVAQAICSLVRSAIFEALHNATLALHYKPSPPSVCLMCPCGVGESHGAKINTKMGFYICSKNHDKSGKLTPNHRVWLDKPLQQSPHASDRCLSEKDIPVLMEKLATCAAKWREIGTALGFTPNELSVIEAKPALFYGAPTSFLADMLNQWVQWTPETVHATYATVDALRRALRSKVVGLGTVAESFSL